MDNVWILVVLVGIVLTLVNSTSLTLEGQINKLGRDDKHLNIIRNGNGSMILLFIK